MIIALGIIGLIALALVVVSGRFFLLLNDTCLDFNKWRVGKMTPAEIDAAYRYAVDHPPLKSINESGPETGIQPGSETGIQPGSETEIQTELQVKIYHQIDPAKQEARTKEWAERKAQQEAAAAAEQEAAAAAMAAIQRDFPAWLIDLAERRNLDRDYSSLQALVEWIDRILVYGQESGRLSVPSVYKQFGRCDQAPPKASSWFFFEDLLKTLETVGLVKARPGNAGRLVLGVRCGLRVVTQELPKDGD